MSSNSAAWIKEKHGKPLVVDEAPLASPSADEILVKNCAVAINPVDWLQQEMALFPMDYPNIMGTDVAGEVVEVGDNVKAFKNGDRVIGHAHQLKTTKPKHGAFQHYTHIHSSLAAHLPSSISFSAGSVLPLAISTASAGLFQKDYLGLPYPTVPSTPVHSTLIVWGGSSSVGSATIQLARAAGLDVVTTCSVHNFDYCKNLGARECVDYSSSDVVAKLIEAVKGKKVAGAYDAITKKGSTEALAEVLEKVDGGKFVACVLEPPKELKGGVGAKFVFGPIIVDNEVAGKVWGEYVGKALDKGTLKPAPDALIVGQGLDKVQEGMMKNKEGLSAKKVVVTL